MFEIIQPNLGFIFLGIPALGWLISGTVLTGLYLGSQYDSPADEIERSIKTLSFTLIAVALLLVFSAPLRRTLSGFLKLRK
jgi:membrane protein DedA with SNARE-associated domain